MAASKDCNCTDVATCHCCCTTEAVLDCQHSYHCANQSEVYAEEQVTVSNSDMFLSNTWLMLTMLADNSNDQVLSERWGSAAEIAKGLIDGAAATAAAADHSGSRQHSSSSHPAGGSRDRGPAAQYLADVSLRSEQAAMRRPASGGSRNRLSWRQTDERRAGGAHSRGEEPSRADRGDGRHGDREPVEAGDSRGRHHSIIGDRDRDWDRNARDRGVDGYRGREEQARGRDSRSRYEHEDREQEASRHRRSPDRNRHQQRNLGRPDQARHEGDGRAGEGCGDNRQDRMQQQQQHKDSRRGGAHEGQHIQRQQAKVCHVLRQLGGSLCMVVLHWPWS